MTLVKWTPIRTRPATRIFNELDSWMDQVMNNRPVFTKNIDSWNPGFAVNDSEKEYIITADLPGMEKKEIDISVQENILKISGERKSEFENKSDQYSEIGFGKFNRTFNLPDHVNEESIKAQFKNGVLTLNIPKIEPIKPEVKTITIK
ncbi:MAG: Hsp20/alpha crystallin family protein [Candidatus Marinimicrobia bacterium]|jgi:HSP20 family protein|nr:Hsp20/alpha crystallin family protein [Candidatus Neomarinimicrobiota bacterium]MBT3632992.1 Hsp20/alpha crystallin family protein [Candidatus Neomarinimicrobiota bacterium]MBT3682102.1 Hsp20/alpha crystallin family protein [Candidatus Neomarinimicrobiota bacterium]MBT3760780.1 Hsp20/alpha crystallin family protein [Candidatus Neomarinimicrobiota bacterium]MBT3895232.1 Hsp20/alpha crystallin family protein [Candidatus Neomarinimicrobiota bacterium]